MGRFELLCCAWIAAASAAACGSNAREGVLELSDFRQLDSTSVALNEPLSFYFSESLDLSSVTSDSVRILDDEGREVAGDRQVRRNALTFVPRLPRASDLSDGGLRPGRTYRVFLGGFPRPDGLRAESGAVLTATLLLTFRTTQVGDKSPLFHDPVKGQHVLKVRGKLGSTFIAVDDGRIVLECDEPLDPASVPLCRFELLHFPQGETRELVPVSARLSENRGDHAEIQLEESSTREPLPPGDYYLSMVDRPRPLNLGGRPVEPGWFPRQPIKVPYQRLELDFGSYHGSPGDTPPSCDGTAPTSANEGGAWLRFPAAAGDGSAGRIELAERPASADTHATSVLLPAGVEVDLSESPGPLVLRAQGVLEIRGRLLRRGPGPISRDPPTSDKSDPVTKALEDGERLPASHRGELSAWVERLLAPEASSHQPWTVLIAGGDLRVPKGGSIDVDGPLVLVAGGQIRVEGRVYSHDTVWRTGEGGGNVSAPNSRLRLLPLELDPPRTNPLRVPLTFGLLTRTLGWTRRAGDWRTVLVGREGAGRILAEFLQAPEGDGPERAISDPNRLAPTDFRVLVRLEVAAGHGEVWDPPRLERLTLESVPLPALAAPAR